MGERNIGSATAYSRGWQSLSHALGTFRSSALRQIVVSLVLGAVIGGASIRAELDERARAHLRAYAVASVWSALWPDKVVKATIDGVELQATSAQIATRLQPAFGGRRAAFMAWQWLLRTVVLAVCMAPLLVLAMVAFGRRMTSDRHRRGAKLVDTTSFGYVHRREVALASVMGLGALGGALCGIVVVAKPSGLTALPHLVAAWLAVHSEAVAALLSPASDGAVIWTPSPVGRLVAPATSYELFAELLGGAGVGSLVAGVVVGLVVGAYVAGFVWFRKMKREAVDPDALTIGGVPIPRKRETAHFLICGATGSGKSVANTVMLQKTRERGQRAILLDTSGEYVAKFYRPGKDFILSPSDARGAPWTPWADIRRAEDCISLGKSLFPTGAQGRDDFWATAGSSVFAGLLEKLDTWEAQCNTYLAFLVERLGPAQLTQVLAGTVGERFVDGGAQQTATSVVMTTAASLRSWRYLRDPEPGELPFSIRKFVEDETSDAWLFVMMRDEDEAMMKPLVSLWFDIAINAVLSLPGEDESMAHTDRRRLFVSLDELQALAKLPALEGALYRGRKKGLCVTLGIQSIKGVRAIYGNNEADALLGQPQTQLVLRTPEEGTAKWLEGQLGSAEIERVGESQQLGGSTARDGVNVNRAVAQEAVVLAAEIQDLPDLVGYLKMVGEPVMKVRYLPGGPKPTQPGFVQGAPPAAPTAPPAWLALEKLGEAEKLLLGGERAAAGRLANEALELAPEGDSALRARITGFQERAA